MLIQKGRNRELTTNGTKAILKPSKTNIKSSSAMCSTWGMLWQDVNSKELELPSLMTLPVVVNFMASTCAGIPCSCFSSFLGSTASLSQLYALPSRDTLVGLHVLLLKWGWKDSLLLISNLDLARTPLPSNSTYTTAWILGCQIISPPLVFTKCRTWEKYRQISR